MRVSKSLITPGSPCPHCKHGVAAILLLGAFAVLTGARSFAAIAEYTQDTGCTILDTLGVGAVVPHARTDRQLNQSRR